MSEGMTLSPGLLSVEHAPDARPAQVHEQGRHDRYADDGSRLGARHDAEYVTEEMYREAGHGERVAPASPSPEACSGNDARTRHHREKKDGPAVNACQALMATGIQPPHRLERTARKCQRDRGHARHDRANKREDAE